MTDNLPGKRSDIFIYQSEDGKTRIDVRLEGEMVWLAQAERNTLQCLSYDNCFEEYERYKT